MSRPRKSADKRRAGTIGVSCTSEDLARLDALTATLPGTTRHGLAREAMRLGLDLLEQRFSRKR
jgi:hypothetical protein